MLKKKSITRLLSVLLILSMLMNVFPALHIQTVKASGGGWIITDPTDDRQVENDQLKWTLTHHAGSNIRYLTTGYMVSLERLNTNEPMTSSYNRGVDYRVVPIYRNSDIVTGNTKITTYTMEKADFLQAIQDLGVTPNDLRASGNSGITIYLNPVYDTYTGDSSNPNTRKTNIKGLQEMLAAEAWGSQTRGNLPGFYNKTYQITTQNLYPVEVHIVDQDMNSLRGATNSSGQRISSPIYKSETYHTSSFSYTLPSTHEELEKSSIKYKYSNSYQIKYNVPPSGSPYGYGGTGNSVDINSSPNATAEGLKIYFIYEQEEAMPYKVDVVAEDTGGKRLQTFQSNMDATPGQEFKFTVGANRYIIENDTGMYHYQHQYYLSYTNPEGKQVNSSVSDRTNIAHTMPAVKEGTKATFHVIYDKDETVIPTPTPVPDEPRPPIPEVIVPDPEPPYTVPYTRVSATGGILADNKGAQKFHSRTAIPTTESLYGEASATEYIIGCTFEKHVGIERFDVTVSKDYILRQTAETPEEDLEEGQEPEVEEEIITVSHTISVPRAYGYWQIRDMGYYTIDNVVLNNYALPGGSVTLNPSGYSTPHVSAYRSGSNVTPPDEAIYGIKLEAEVIDGGTEKPILPDEYELFEYEALYRTGNARVRNDHVSWNGTTVMNSNQVETEGPTIRRDVIKQCNTMTDDGVLYKSGQIIEATKSNGNYPSNGTVRYRSRVAINRSSSLSYSVNGVNSVTIHTPVVCKPTIAANNDQWVQLINPDSDAVQLVIDEDPRLNDFTVKVSNHDFHSSNIGYGTRDFTWSLRSPDTVSYMAKRGNLFRNEVKFPFDVYQDVGKDYKPENDNFIKAGTWITIGHNDPRFYLPMWVKEGIYNVEFRSIAVNGENKLQYTEVGRNQNRSNYVATNTVKVQVSGRIYGLTLYDVSDYPMWERAFRMPNSSRLKINYPGPNSVNYPGTNYYKNLGFPTAFTGYLDGTLLNNNKYSSNYHYYYTVGTKDQYGNDTQRNSKYTFPMVNGSHPQYINQGILKSGYIVRFKLQTTGDMASDNSKVVIEPAFYFIDKNGENRQAVDVYYTEEIEGKSRNLVKVGSRLDSINTKRIETGDLHLNIPVNELQQTAAMRGEKYGNYIWQSAPMFTFAQINLSHHFRTFVNQDYAKKIKSLPSYNKVKDAKISDVTLSEGKQNWYGQYYLPNIMHIAPAGYDVMDYADKYGISYNEGFWLKDGYIIVNFNIYTIDKNNNRNISYTADMWNRENPPLSKTSYGGTKFSFSPGDFVIYYSSKNVDEDYRTGPAY